MLQSKGYTTKMFVYYSIDTLLISVQMFVYEVNNSYSLYSNVCLPNESCAIHLLQDTSKITLLIFSDVVYSIILIKTTLFNPKYSY